MRMSRIAKTSPSLGATPQAAIPRIRFDHQDITKVPLERIPNHTLLAAWLPLRQKASHFERRELRILAQQDCRDGTIRESPMRGGTSQNRAPRQKASGSPCTRRRNWRHPSTGPTFAYHHYAGFDLPLSRQNLYIVGARADQDHGHAPFAIKSAWLWARGHWVYQSPGTSSLA